VVAVRGIEPRFDG